MKITSSVFNHGESIPKKYTCEGSNISPPLDFEDIPSEAKSLVLVVEDPDVPSENPWVHWVVFNISPNTKGLAENEIVPGAIQGLNTSNNLGYGGPCPPKGEHRYYFKLFALDIDLALPAESDKMKISQHMKGHIIEKAELIGLYEKNIKEDQFKKLI